MNITTTIPQGNIKHTTTYGGNITKEDFEVEYRPLTFIADKIVADWRFDKMCKVNVANKECYKGRRLYSWR